MDELVTTCVQQQIRIFESHGEFRNDIQRFMRLAKVKESHLVVFPELCGLLLAPPLIRGLKRTLLRVAERQVKRRPSLVDRMVGRLADSASGMSGGISDKLIGAISDHEGALRDAYLTIFSEVAREYGMYIVGGSIYLPDPSDGQVHNTAFLFSPTGEIIGQQNKLVLSALDRLVCQPTSRGLEVFETDFGNLGILIGQDVLYPEAGRILAGAGAQFIANLALSTSQSSFLKMRNALAARLQENLMMGSQSFLVGRNIIGQTQDDFIGKSAILAPMDLTTRSSGVLAEVGSTVTEGIVSATWDLNGLYELRGATDVPSTLPLAAEVFRSQAQRLYGSPVAETLTPVMPVPEGLPDQEIAGAASLTDDSDSSDNAAAPALGSAPPEPSSGESEPGAPVPITQTASSPATTVPEDTAEHLLSAPLEAPQEVEPDLEAEPVQIDVSEWIADEAIYIPSEPLFATEEAERATESGGDVLPAEPESRETISIAVEDARPAPLWPDWQETQVAYVGPGAAQEEQEWTPGRWDFGEETAPATDSALQMPVEEPILTTEAQSTETSFEEAETFTEVDDHLPPANGEAMLEQEQPPSPSEDLTAEQITASSDDMLTSATPQGSDTTSSEEHKPRWPWGRRK